MDEARKYSLRFKNFVPLPSDPNVKLTSEQLDALFPPENRHVWNEVIRKAMQKNAESGDLSELSTNAESES